jgi:hypothetical protein
MLYNFLKRQTVWERAFLQHFCVYSVYCISVLRKLTNS